jgi:hypothetical protein
MTTYSATNTLAGLAALGAPASGAKLTGVLSSAGGNFNLDDVAAYTAGTYSGFQQVGTGAVARTMQAKARDAVYVADFGATGDGTNESTKIQAAIDALSAAGGGALRFAPKTYIASIAPKNGVLLIGAGPATVIKAPPATNLPAVGTSDFAARVGTDDPSGTSPHDFGIWDMTLDGNGATQTATGSARDLCNTVQIYGYRYSLARLTIQNARGHNLRTEWGAYGDFAMQSTFEDIRTDTCGRHGWWFNGPHDSIINGVFPVDSSQETDNGYCGVFTGTNGPAQWNMFHAWHRSTVSNRMRVSFSSGFASKVTNSQFEGGRILFESRGGYDSIGGCSAFYACYGAANGTMLDILANNVTLGSCIFQNSPTADVYAIRIGRSGATVNGFIMGDDVLIFGFGTRGAFDVAGDGGLNRLAGTGYGNAVTASINAQTRSNYLSSGPADVLVQNPMPGPYASDAAAATAGVPLNYPYRKTGGTVAWRQT